MRRKLDYDTALFEQIARELGEGPAFGPDKESFARVGRAIERIKATQFYSDSILARLLNKHSVPDRLGRVGRWSWPEVSAVYEYVRDLDREARLDAAGVPRRAT